MYKLVIILTFFTLTSSKLSELPDLWFFEYTNAVDWPDLQIKKAPIVQERAKDLWVLKFDLDGLGPFRLTLGTEKEENDFNAVIEPMIDRYSDSRAKTDGLAKQVKEKRHGSNTYTKLKIIKEQIRKIVNKFVLSHMEIGSHLPGVDEEHSKNPSISLFFKGPFTSLMVEFGKKQWHYFIRPPSPFSNWFHGKHSKIIHKGEEVYVEIPAVLKPEFYSALLRLLRNLLSFPV